MVMAPIGRRVEQGAVETVVPHDIGRVVGDVAVAVLVEDAGAAALARGAGEGLLDHHPTAQLEHPHHDQAEDGHDEGHLHGGGARSALSG